MPYRQTLWLTELLSGPKKCAYLAAPLYGQYVILLWTTQWQPLIRPYLIMSRNQNCCQTGDQGLALDQKMYFFCQIGLIFTGCSGSRLCLYSGDKYISSQVQRTIIPYCPGSEQCSAPWCPCCPHTDLPASAAPPAHAQSPYVAKIYDMYFDENAATIKITVNFPQHSCLYSISI